MLADSSFILQQLFFLAFFFHGLPSRIFFLYFIKVNKPPKITLAAATAASRQMLVNEVHLHILGRQIGGREAREEPSVVARQLVPTDFFSVSFHGAVKSKAQDGNNKKAA